MVPRRAPGIGHRYARPEKTWLCGPPACFNPGRDQTPPRVGEDARPNFVEIIFDSWRFLQKERGVRIFGYVLLENYLHWIASGHDLLDQVSRFKSYTARRIIDRLEQCGFTTLLEELRFFKLRHKIGQTHQLWQEGSHPQQIQNDETMTQKVEYMHLNPVRRGYAVFECTELCGQGGLNRGGYGLAVRKRENSRQTEPAGLYATAAILRNNGQFAEI